jgi:hypothetical protein
MKSVTGGGAGSGVVRLISIQTMMFLFVLTIIHVTVLNVLNAIVLGRCVWVG